MMKYNALVKLLHAEGRSQVRQKGSHRAFKHNTKQGVVTIAWHRLNDEFPPDTLNSIFKQAGLEQKNNGSTKLLQQLSKVGCQI